MCNYVVLDVTVKILVTAFLKKLPFLAKGLLRVADFISFDVRGQWNNHDLFKNTILYKNNAISHYVVSISNKCVDVQTYKVVPV